MSTVCDAFARKVYTDHRPIYWLDLVRFAAKRKALEKTRLVIRCQKLTCRECGSFFRNADICI